jgi:lysophospholipase L1-like esterase
MLSKYIYCLLVPLFLTNCKKTETQPTVYTATKPIKILALGDSYTKGQSVPQEQSFPYLLRDELDQTNQVKVEKLPVIAQTGWTTTNLINALNNITIIDTFDLVTLLIGVNNQYQQKPISLYETEFLQLLQRSIGFAGGDTNRVAVISIPDYGATPYGSAEAERIGKEIDQYNAIGKRIADSLHVTYFDITPISRKAATDATLTAPDLLHPSGKMYALWVQMMLPTVLEKVK